MKGHSENEIEHVDKPGNLSIAKDRLRRMHVLEANSGHAVLCPMFAPGPALCQKCPEKQCLSDRQRLLEAYLSNIYATGSSELSSVSHGWIRESRND